jgi:GNAT superfamily N-acetyltransferase
MRSRPATRSDLGDVTATLTAAFAGDPLWRWAFPRLEDLEVFWRFVIASGLRYPWVRVRPTAFGGACPDGFEAVALWIPPGGTELTEQEEAELPALFERQIGARAADLLELLDRFEAAHPRDRPHYYLSLLGTDPAHRGKGLGMALLAENLALIDAEGMPAYLESSNPSNNARYEGVGFVKVGEFTTPDDAHVVATMWREPPIG